MNSLLKRIESLGYIVKISKNARNFIADKGYDSQFGARPLKRAIQKYLEDIIAEEIVNSNLQDGDTIVITLAKDEASLNVKINKAKKDKPKKPKENE